MFEVFLDFFNDKFNLFDTVFLVIMIYSMLTCALKGFSLSFISFMKWVLSLIITIIAVPKLQPWVGEYVESEFINSIGLGIFIFIFSLFIIILIGKAFSRTITWTGLGSIDKSFGFLFGVFRGYAVSVCLFTILNWFYPYQNWYNSVENAMSFNIVKVGSEVLIEEFPKNEEFKDTKEKIEKI